MPPIQNHHSRRSRLYDTRRSRCSSPDNGDLRPDNSILFGVQLCDKVHKDLPFSELSTLTFHHRIIEPLASRCSKFRFTPLDSDSASLRLSHIAQCEGIPISKSVIDALIHTSSGDLRRAITYLQSASRLSSSTVPATPILPRDIQEIAGVVPDSVITDFARVLGVEIADEMDVDEAPRQKQSGFESIKKKVKFLMREGYSATQIISQVCVNVTYTEGKELHKLPKSSCMISSFLMKRWTAGRNLPVLLSSLKLINRYVMVETKNYGSWKLVCVFTRQ